MGTPSKKSADVMLIVALDGLVTRLEGLILFAGFLTHLLFMLREQRGAARASQNEAKIGAWSRKDWLLNTLLVFAGLALLVNGVEQFNRQRLHTFSHLPGQARRERLMHELPQPRVIRRVEIDHGAFKRTEHRRYPRLLAKLFRRQGVIAALREALIRKQCLGIFVTRHQPNRGFIRQCDTADGVFRAHTREEKEWIRLKFPTEDVYLLRCIHHSFRPSPRIHSRAAPSG
jgi:hypothetical protein